jgi:hypothetical protein
MAPSKAKYPFVMLQTSQERFNNEKPGAWILPKKYYLPMTKVMPPNDQDHAWKTHSVHLD